MQAVIDAQEEAEHTRAVGSQADSLLSLLKDAETGQRGYLLTGDKRYLEPYQTGLAKSPEALALLRDMTSEHSDQQQRIDALGSLVTERLDILTGNLSLHDSSAGTPFDKERLDQGKRSMDGIRSAIAAMVQEEARHHQRQTAHVQNEAETVYLFFILGIAAATIVLAGNFYVMVREVRRRRAVEGELQGLNANLERLVEARTAETERQERFLTAILQNMPDALFVRKNGAIAFANDACVPLFGVSKVEDLTGRSLFDFFQAADRTLVAERLEILSEPGHRVPVVVEKIFRDDGGTIEVEATAASFVDDSEMAVLTILHDITDRQRLEQQLRHAQKLEAVGQLTGGIAHDFNNLLTIILGNADSIAEEVREDARLRFMAEMVQGAAIRAAELTHRLLAFSRKQDLEPLVVDINTQLAGLQTLMERTLEEEVNIEIIQGPSLWKALVDPSQLENAILNLAINARDAMPGGGRLTIETFNTRLDREYADRHAEVVPGPYVVLAVTDTGSGMPADVIERAFEPFFTTKEVGEGSGLGLSMVYGFVKQSGGHIKIYSELGEGTTIKLYLPKADDAMAAEQRKAERAEAMPGGTERIAVVEDDENVRKHIEMVLGELGYTVRAYGGGATLIDDMEDGYVFDLLLTDVVLPGGMDGPALAGAVRQRLQPLKVLFASGYTANAIAHQGRLDAGAPLLHKPFRKTDLAGKVRAVLDAD